MHEVCASGLYVKSRMSNSILNRMWPWKVSLASAIVVDPNVVWDAKIGLSGCRDRPVWT